ncbi:MAG: hypothetical protein U1E21_01330 [Reyranellaceae bacterium]
MADDKTASFDEVVDFVSTDRKVTVLLGAGASATAGIPLANGIVARALADYPNLEQKVGTDPTYARCMAALPTGVRHNLVRAVCAGAKINWAHVALALVMRAGYVNRVPDDKFHYHAGAGLRAHQGIPGGLRSRSPPPKPSRRR